MILLCLKVLKVYDGAINFVIKAVNFMTALLFDSTQPRNVVFRVKLLDRRLRLMELESKNIPLSLNKVLRR